MSADTFAIPAFFHSLNSLQYLYPSLPMLPLNRRRAEALAPSVGQIEDRLHNLCPALTRRESEVCARAAIGMSVEATALDLDIARTSVMTYRKRGYQRLGISSVRELCALVAH